MLQNLDLDTVTFAQVQSTGDPISIEDMNEQEMTDLIIVNLARLCVAGEWDGLLSGGLDVIFAGTSFDDVEDTLAATSLPPFGRDALTSTTESVDNNRPIFIPFICPADLTIENIQINVSTAAASPVNIDVGIYSANTSDGSPNASLAEATFDVASTGAKTTALGSTIDLSKNTLYWFGYVRDAAVTSVLYAHTTDSNSMLTTVGSWNQPQIYLTSSDNTLPATITSTNLKTQFGYAAMIFLGVV
jgi:hypothetical protein